MACRQEIMLIIWHRATQCEQWVRSRIHLGVWFNIKMSSYQYRKSHCGDRIFNCLISTMGFPTLVKWHLYIEWEPGVWFNKQSCQDMGILSTLLALCEGNPSLTGVFFPYKSLAVQNFSLLLAWTSCQQNNRVDIDLWGHDAHVMSSFKGNTRCHWLL